MCVSAYALVCMSACVRMRSSPRPSAWLPVRPAGAPSPHVPYASFSPPSPVFCKPLALSFLLSSTRMFFSLTKSGLSDRKPRDSEPGSGPYVGRRRAPREGAAPCFSPRGMEIKPGHLARSLSSRRLGRRNTHFIYSYSSFPLSIFTYIFFFYLSLVSLWGKGSCLF